LASGQLYVAEPGSGTLRPLGRSIHDLIADAPFVTANGYVYLGQKISTMLALDSQSGAIVKTYGPLDVDISLAYGQQHGLGPQALLIGRTEHHLTVRERNTAQLQLNITV
jgi:hypothetical protein